MKPFRLMLVLIMLAVCTPASADEMFMKNGSKLIGTLVSAENDTIVFDTPFAGQISVNEANVERIVTDTTVIIMMDDGTIYRDRRIDASEGTLVATAENEPPATFSATDIKLINPEPWKLGQGYRWSGRASAASEYKRGNSDTDEWDVALNAEWRSLKDRYTARYEFERDRSDGDKTSDNWDLGGRYDRFSRRDPRNYWGGGVLFEYDRFADLDLRTTIGPHIGRQFFETGPLTLAGEIGPVWVDEQFDEAEDDDYAGLRWAFRGTSDVVGFGTELYMNQDGTWNLDSTDDLILNTTIGIRMPLIFGFETGAEMKWEYDRGAPDDVDDLDETYSFRLGYAW